MTTGALNDKKVLIQIRNAKPTLAVIKNVEGNLGVWFVGAGDLVVSTAALKEIQTPAFFAPWTSVDWIAVQSTF